MIFCSPHNPVGRVWEKEELKKLAEIALENNVIVFSDEIWNDIIMPGYKHTLMASISKEIGANTITATAPSKTFNVALFPAPEIPVIITISISSSIKINYKKPLFTINSLLYIIKSVEYMKFFTISRKSGFGKIFSAKSKVLPKFNLEYI